jgi:hypothetical protein
MVNLWDAFSSLEDFVRCSPLAISFSGFAILSILGQFDTQILIFFFLESIKLRVFWPKTIDGKGA